MSEIFDPLFGNSDLGDVFYNQTPSSGYMSSLSDFSHIGITSFDELSSSDVSTLLVNDTIMGVNLGSGDDDEDL